MDSNVYNIETFLICIKFVLPKNCQGYIANYLFLCRHNQHDISGNYTNLRLRSKRSLHVIKMSPRSEHFKLLISSMFIPESVLFLGRIQNFLPLALE